MNTKGAPKQYLFKKGNPGKPKGAKNQTTLLKEKILSAALTIDLKGNRKAVSALGKVVNVPNIRPEELIKVAATFVPKEQTIKGEGFESGNLTAIFAQLSEADLRGLIQACRKSAGPEEPLKLD